MPGSESNQEYVSPIEFGKIAGLSLATVRRYVKEGRLPSLQPGGKRCRVLIPRSALGIDSSRADGLAATSGTDLDDADGQSAFEARIANDEHVHDLSGPKPRWMKTQNLTH